MGTGDIAQKIVKLKNSLNLMEAHAKLFQLIARPLLMELQDTKVPHTASWVIKKIPVLYYSFIV